MEQRQHRQGDVVGLEPEEVAAGGRGHEQLEVGELGALGPAGRAAGVQQHRGVVRAQRLDVAGVLGQVQVVEGLGALGPVVGTRQGHGVGAHAAHRLRRLRRFLAHRRERDEDLGVAVAEVVLDLGQPQERVERHHHQARLHDAEVGEHELGQVGQLHGHLVAGLEVEGEEAGGHPARQLVDLLVGQRDVPHVDEGLVGGGLGRLPQHRRQVEAHRSPVGRVTAAKP